MFNASIIDVIVLCPILLAFVSGYLIDKIEDSRPVLGKVLGLVVMTILLGVGVYLKTTFTTVSIVLLQGLFYLNHYSSISGIVLILFFLFIHLGSKPNLGIGLSSKALFNFLGLLLALNFANNLILVLIFSEIIILKASLPMTKTKVSLDLEGAKIRLIGLIFILGSIAVNFGGGNFATLDFLEDNASRLYSADYLFLIGALFVLAGLIQIVLRLIKAKTGNFGAVNFIMGAALLVVINKYSSGQIFSVLNEAQSLIQWLCVLMLIFTALKSIGANSLRALTKFIFLNTLAISITLSLPFMFDGKGYNTLALLHMLSTFSGLLILNIVREHLELFKGEDLLLDELRGFGAKFPNSSLLIITAVITGLSFPLVAGLAIFTAGLKHILENGFYWVGLWVLISTSIIWLVSIKIIRTMYFRNIDDDLWTLWRNREVKDTQKFKSLILTIGVMILPILSLCFLNL